MTGLLVTKGGRRLPMKHQITVLVHLPFSELRQDANSVPFRKHESETLGRSRFVDKDSTSKASAED